MYRIQFYCPQKGPLWQNLTTGIWPFKRLETFSDLASAAARCDSLIWTCHSARVLDQWGRVAYQV